MNTNNALQNQALIAWTGAAATPRPINKHTNFAFCFEVVTTLVADAIFNVMSYAPDAVNPCVAGAVAVPVPTVPICTGAAVVAQGQVIIPSGTVAGTILTGTIPCRPNAFVGLVHVSGGANVRAVMVLSGPI